MLNSLSFHSQRCAVLKSYCLFMSHAKVADPVETVHSKWEYISYYYFDSTSDVGVNFVVFT